MKNKMIFLFSIIMLILISGMLFINGLKKELPTQFYDYLIIGFGALFALSTLAFLFVLFKTNTKKMP